MSLRPEVDRTKAYLCLECGICTGSCPVSRYHPAYSPRMTVEKALLLGEDEIVCDSEMWSCLTCGTCDQRCPSTVDFTGFMRALRGKARDRGEDGVCTHAETLLASLDDDEPGDSDFDFAKTEALPKDAFTGDINMDETGEMPAVASTDVELDLDDLTAALEINDVGDTVEQPRDDATVEQPRPVVPDLEDTGTVSLGADDMSDELSEARTMTEVGTKLDLARAYVDMGDPAGARSILEEVLDEGDDGQRQQAQQLLDSLPS